jgi:hypothetical protein
MTLQVADIEIEIKLYRYDFASAQLFSAMRWGTAS